MGGDRSPFSEKLRGSASFFSNFLGKLGFMCWDSNGLKPPWLLSNWIKWLCLTRKFAKKITIFVDGSIPKHPLEWILDHG
jgi:hypothetical protein